MAISESVQKKINIIGGSVLAVIGIILLGYSLFVTVWQSEKKDILSLLPASKFSFLLSLDHSYSPSEMTTSEFLSFIGSVVGKSELPKGTLVGYTSSQNTEGVEYFFIFPEDEVPSKYTNCAVEYSYAWCTDATSLSLVYSILESIEKKSPTLSHLPSLQSADALFTADTSISFLGATAFLQNNSFLSSLPVSVQQRQKVGQTITAITPVLPLFSGNVNTNTGIYSFAFHKKDEQKMYPFTGFSSEFSPKVFSSSVDRYLLVKSPLSFWNYANTAIDMKEFPQVLSLQSWAKDKINTLFAQKLSWQEDIAPLMQHDMMVYSSADHSSVIFSLPSSDYSRQWYSKISSLLQSFAAQKVPTKKEHTLADGTVISEVFPEASAIAAQKIRSPSGEGEGINFTAPQEVNPKTFPVTAYKNNQLFISESPLDMNLFFSPDMSISSFVFPTDQNVFLSFGIKARKDEKIPFLFAEMVGIEKKKLLLFVGKIDFNPSYFLSTPTEGALATPFPTELGAPTPSSLAPTAQ